MEELEREGRQMKENEGWYESRSSDVRWERKEADLKGEV